MERGVDRDMYEGAYYRVQQILDEALGSGEGDGSGEGIAGDVYLVVQQRDRAREVLAAALEALERYDAEMVVRFRQLADEPWAPL